MYDFVSLDKQQIQLFFITKETYNIVMDSSEYIWLLNAV